MPWNLFEQLQETNEFSMWRQCQLHEKQRASNLQFNAVIALRYVQNHEQTLIEITSGLSDVIDSSEIRRFFRK